MKNLLSIVLLMLTVLSAFGQQTIVRTIITITNSAPTNGHTLVWSVQTRTWTNDPSASPGTLIALTNGIGFIQTNLFNHLSDSPFNRAHYLTKSNNNVVALRGGPGEVMTMTASGWASVTYQTQTIANPLSGPLVLPLSQMTATNREQYASWLVEAFAYATNTMPTNVLADILDDYANRFGSETLSNKALFSSRFEGSVSNSVVTNSTLGRMNVLEPSATTNAEGLIFYSGSTPTTKISSYIGYPIIKGMGTNVYDVSADPDDLYMLNYLSAKKLFPSMFLGRGVDSNRWETVNYFTGGTNEFYSDLKATNVTLNTVTATNVTIDALRATNTLTHGTNVHAGSTAYTPGLVESLVNGNNAGIELGTNTIVLLSGPTTYSELAGFKAKESGRIHWLRLTGAATNYVINYTGSSRSTDPAPANRIETGTGGDLVLTNNPAWLQIYYDTVQSRWQVMQHSR